MGTVTIKILELNAENRVCVAEVTDNNVIIATGNFGLDELNPDGTANTVWITNRVKQYVIDYRKDIAQTLSANKITSTINSSSEE